MHNHAHAMTSMAVTIVVTTQGLVGTLQKPIVLSVDQLCLLEAERIYQEQLTVFALEAQMYFATIEPSPKLAVIFDIDDTVLEHGKVSTEITYGNNLYTCFQALAPMRTLYQYLIARKFTTFFISSRPETSLTKQDLEVVSMYNLNNEGFTNFRALFCKPASEDALNPAIWKQKMRERLESFYGYTIIATFDDDPGVFSIGGKCTGKQFLVPRLQFLHIQPLQIVEQKSKETS